MWPFASESRGRLATLCGHWGLFLLSPWRACTLQSLLRKNLIIGGARHSFPDHLISQKKDRGTKFVLNSLLGSINCVSFTSHSSLLRPHLCTHFIIREKTDVPRWGFSTGSGVGSRAGRTQAGRSPCALLTTGTCSDPWNKVAQLGDYFKGHHAWPRTA